MENQSDPLIIYTAYSAYFYCDLFRPFLPHPLHRSLMNTFVTDQGYVCMNLINGFLPLKYDDEGTMYS